MLFNTLGRAWETLEMETWLPKGEKLAVKYGVSKERYAYYVRHHRYAASEIGVRWDCAEIKQIEQDARDNESSFVDVVNAEAQAEAYSNNDDSNND